MTKLDNKKIYNRYLLKFYNILVLSISNFWIWRCSTRKYLLPFFQRNISNTHLDVGVGSGFYSHKTEKIMSICDSNEQSLKAATRNNQRIDKVILHDVRYPFEDSHLQKYSSISCFYLFHCIPGTFRENPEIFDNLKNIMKKDGVFYGATIINTGAEQPLIARMLNRFYNKIGVFHNERDTIEILQNVLNKHFTAVKVDKIGSVALFHCIKG